MKITSSELVANHKDRLLELRLQGLGRYKIADTLSQETGHTITPSVIRWALAAIELGKSSGDPVPIKEESPVKFDDENIEDWIAQRVRASKRKIAKASKSTRHLTLPAEPLGIAVLGDPHVDNEGCDWGLLYDHIQMIKQTPGAIASCVGDMQDNWIGRLGKLYSGSSTTASDGWKASEWLLRSVQWIALVGGNHDAWSHSPGIDPLEWLTRDCGVQCYDSDELRLHLSWADRPDLEPIIWVLRHDFSGRSWYHPTHGPHKEAMLDGRCHLLTAGHIHQWGVLTTEQRHGRVTHAVRVRGYKRADQYAKQKGFFEQRHGAACFVVIDPEAEEPARIRLFWDMEVGCDYLTWLRGSKKSIKD